MQEIIDLVSRKTLHWFSYVANFCWILLGLCFGIDIESANRDLTFVVAQMATKSKK